MAPGPSSCAGEHPIACRGPEGDSALVAAWRLLTLGQRSRTLSALPLRRAPGLHGPDGRGGPGGERSQEIGGLPALS